VLPQYPFDVLVPRPTDVVAAIPATTPFVGPEAIEREMGQSFELRLGANESLFGPSPHAIEAMQAQAAIGHFYGDPEGYRLRTEIAMRNECGIENVILASGIDELLMLFCRAYVAPGDKVVTTRGSYPTFEYAVRSVGGELNYADYANARLNLPALTEVANELAAKALYIANPDNPTGSWRDPRSIDGIFENLREDCLLLLDEAYADLVPELDHFDPANPRVVRFRTFSKGYGMAGIRVGFALASSAHVTAINKIRMHFGVSSVAQAGALAALRDTEFLHTVVSETRRVRQWLANQLSNIGVASLPSQTNFILIDLGSKERAEACLLSLRAARVFVRKPALPPLDKYIRVSIGPQPVMEEFVRRFAEAVV
jgi:histidinol-phosphate aminotransferase